MFARGGETGEDSVRESKKTQHARTSLIVQDLDSFLRKHRVALEADSRILIRDAFHGSTWEWEPGKTLVSLNHSVGYDGISGVCSCHNRVAQYTTMKCARCGIEIFECHMEHGNTICVKGKGCWTGKEGRLTQAEIQKQHASLMRRYRQLETAHNVLMGELGTVQSELASLALVCMHPAKRAPGDEYASRDSWECPDCGAFSGTPIDAAPLGPRRRQKRADEEELKKLNG